MPVQGLETQLAGAGRSVCITHRLSQGKDLLGYVLVCPLCLAGQAERFSQLKQER